MSTPDTSTPKPTAPVPKGLKPRDVEKLFKYIDWGEAKAFYEERTQTPELDLVGFVRACILSWPMLPPAWLGTFESLRQNTYIPVRAPASREPLTYEEALGAFARLELKPEHVEKDGAEWLLLRDLAPAFVEGFAPFRAIYRERLASGRWPADVCRVFLLADWLNGSELHADEREAVKRFCAREHYASQRSFRESLEFLAPLCRRDGLEGLTARDLGRAIAGPDGFCAALAAIMQDDPRWALDQVVDVFDALPLEPNAARLADPEDARYAVTRAYVGYVRRRKEPASVLLRVAQQIPGTRLAELLGLEAIARSLDTGAPLPQPAASLVNVDLTDAPTLARYREVLPRLSAPERAALFERPVGVVALAPEDDDAVVRSYVARSCLGRPSFEPKALHVLGNRAADAILARLDEPCDNELRRYLEATLLDVIAAHLVSGGAFDDGWSLYVVLAQNIYTPAFETIFQALPEPLRSDLLVDTVAENREPEQLLNFVRWHGLRESAAPAFIAAYQKRGAAPFKEPLPPMLAALGAKPKEPSRAGGWEVEWLRKLGAAAQGPHETVYVLELVKEEDALPCSTFTAFGGPPPAPLRRGSKSMRHLLTIDLEDAPELASRFPGARAASLFVPREPNFDDDLFLAYEPSFWHDFTDEDLAGRAPSTGRPETLRVHAVSLPAALFEDARGAAEHAAILRALSAFPGYLLGGPFTIQADTGAKRTPDFVAQLGESFDLMLGDCGFLYSYVKGALWDSH